MLSGWSDYLNWLDEGPHSVRLITSNLAPTEPKQHRESIEIPGLGYTSRAELIKEAVRLRVEGLALPNYEKDGEYAPPFPPSNHLARERMREIEEEAEMELSPEKYLVAVYREKWNRLGTVMLIECTSASAPDTVDEVSGNEEWKDERLYWQPIDRLTDFDPGRTQGALLFAKDDWLRKQMTGEGVLWPARANSIIRYSYWDSYLTSIRS